MSTSRKRAAVVSGLLVSIAVLTIGPAGLAGPARADDTIGFDAHAQAVGIDSTVANQSMPIGLVVEGVGPEASSHVTSYGDSDAEASFPYLGPVVPGLLGIFPPLFGLPAVSYPFEATTGSGDEPKDVSAPGISLHAESGSRSNVARATVATESGGATSWSRVDIGDAGDVTVSAESTVNAIQLLNQLTVRAVRSRVKVTANGTTGKLTRSSSFSIGQINVPGLVVAVPDSTPGHVQVPVPLPGVPQPPPVDLPPVQIPAPFGGQTLDEPSIGFEDGYFTTTLPGEGTTKFPIPAQVVLDGFKALGITMSYEPAKNTALGVEGGTFTMAYDFPAPPPPLSKYYSGPTAFTFTMGRASALITTNPVNFDGGASGGSSGSGFGGTGSATGGQSDGISGGGPVALAPGIPGLGMPSVEGATGTGPVPQISAGGSGAGQGSPVASAAALSTSGLLTPVFDARNIYLTFVLVAIGALAGMTLLRLLGVRTLWS
jgi:hypothetical protein